MSTFTHHLMSLVALVALTVGGALAATDCCNGGSCCPDCPCCHSIQK